MDKPGDGILLVESDIADATTVLMALASDDQPRVEWVKRLADGLQRLEQPGIIGIVLNLFLPDSRGIETFDRIRQAAGHLPILVLCRADDEPIGRLAVERGADDFLLPTHLDTYSLTRAVSRMLERHTHDEALFVEKERAEVTLNSIGDAVLSTDISGNVTYLNTVAECMTGWPRAEAVGRPLVEVFNIIDGETRRRSDNPLALAIRENKTVNLTADCILIRRDGYESPIEDSTAPIHDRAGRTTGAVIVFHDVSAARQMAIQLSHQAQHDFLTDLPNRMLLNDRLQQAILLASRHEQRIAVLFLDLDRFKHINDSLGHIIGDQLLQAVATRLTRSVRRSDTVSRRGGDEFVVVLAESDKARNTEIKVARLLAALAMPYRISPHEVHVPVSIGVSIYPDDAEDADTLINNADTAMYHAKENGRNNYQFFTQDMIVDAVERQFIENSPRVALARREFSLHY